MNWLRYLVSYVISEPLTSLAGSAAGLGYYLSNVGFTLADLDDPNKRSHLIVSAFFFLFGFVSKDKNS